jgi:hypothetical protein
MSKLATEPFLPPFAAGSTKVRNGPRMTLNGPFKLLMLRRIRCS